MKIILLISTLFLMPFIVYSQSNDKIIWDDTSSEQWTNNFQDVQITSSKDSSMQRAMFYRSKSTNPRPLIVSLHTWSATYKQEDPLARLILEYDYNFIHPDFRGANNKPKACGSEYVIADLEDAITYALKNANVDPKEVHIIGVSGGGYATLVAYMNVKYPVKSFSAWVPLSNIEDWYWESIGRKQKYAKDVLNCIGSKDILDVEEAQKRSPYFQKYPEQLRKDAKLFIYAGIHDGYTGSVPITQSIDMYNKIASEAFIAADEELVSEKDKLELVTRRCFSSHDFGMNIGDRKVHYFKKKENVSLSIFEGGHEQIVDQVIPLIPINKKYEVNFKTVLNIGDSNSSFEYSWTKLLSKQHIGYDIFNYGIPGNTIGFDNLGQKRLNTLANIDSLLTQVERTHQSIDYVIISIGTNDCKAIFDTRLNESYKNLDTLIKKIESRELTSKSKIIIMTIPPADESKVNKKYYGIERRIVALNEYYKKKARSKNNMIFVDTYSLLKPDISDYTEDGIHLNEKAQQSIAERMNEIFRLN